MRKIIIYLIICISSFSIWLSNEEMLINEKNREYILKNKLKYKNFFIISSHISTNFNNF